MAMGSKSFDFKPTCWNDSYWLTLFHKLKGFTVPIEEGQASANSKLSCSSCFTKSHRSIAATWSHLLCSWLLILASVSCICRAYFKFSWKKKTMTSILRQHGSCHPKYGIFPKNMPYFFIMSSNNCKISSSDRSDASLMACLWAETTSAAGAAIPSTTVEAPTTREPQLQALLTHFKVVISGHQIAAVLQSQSNRVEKFRPQEVKGKIMP